MTNVPLGDRLALTIMLKWHN